MANPRYSQREPRESSSERKMGQLRDLIGMQNAIEGPQLERQALQQRAQTSQLGSVIQLFELMNNQQNSAARNDIALKQLAQGDRDIASRNDPTERIIAALAGLAPIDPDASAALGDYIPQLGQRREQRRQESVSKKRAEALPQVRKLYDEGGPRLPQNLANLEPTIEAEAWNTLPWDELNASLSIPKQSSGVGSLFQGSGPMQAPPIGMILEQIIKQVSAPSAPAPSPQPSASGMSGPGINPLLQQYFQHLTPRF